MDYFSDCAILHGMLGYDVEGLLMNGPLAKLIGKLGEGNTFKYVFVLALTVGIVLTIVSFL